VVSGRDRDFSGTSMASPHVAGVAALYLSAYPWANPTDVRNAIVAGATKSIVTQPGAGSPNALLYNNVAAMPPTPRPCYRNCVS
jgi:subtilisin family serine protease